MGKAVSELIAVGLHPRVGPVLVTELVGCPVRCVEGIDVTVDDIPLTGAQVDSLRDAAVKSPRLIHVWISAQGWVGEKPSCQFCTIQRSHIGMQYYTA